MTIPHEVHFEGKIAQKAIIMKGEKALLVRDPRMAEGVWELPGGRMNIDEEPRAALRRELVEELGVACLIHEVVFMAQFMQGNEGKRAFVIIYRATLADDSKTFVLDEREVGEIRWVGQEELEAYTLFLEYKEALTQFFRARNT